MDEEEGAEAEEEKKEVTSVNWFICFQSLKEAKTTAGAGTGAAAKKKGKSS